MTGEINIPLLVLDFVVILPVTILRLLIIYIYGSKYNVPNFTILDTMMHAVEPKFDIEDKNKSIKRPKLAPKSRKNNKLFEELNELEKEIEDSDFSQDTIYDLIKTADQDNKSVTVIDNDLDKLSKMVSGLIEQRKGTVKQGEVISRSIIQDSSNSSSRKRVRSRSIQISDSNNSNKNNVSSDSVFSD